MNWNQDPEGLIIGFFCLLGAWKGFELAYWFYKHLTISWHA